MTKSKYGMEDDYYQSAPEGSYILTFSLQEEKNSQQFSSRYHWKTSRKISLYISYRGGLAMPVGVVETLLYRMERHIKRIAKRYCPITGTNAC